jgi:hypothetical protein
MEKQWMHIQQGQSLQSKYQIFRELAVEMVDAQIEVTVIKEMITGYLPQSEFIEFPPPPPERSI